MYKILFAHLHISWYFRIKLCPKLAYVQRKENNNDNNSNYKSCVENDWFEYCILHEIKVCILTHTKLYLHSNSNLIFK